GEVGRPRTGGGRKVYGPSAPADGQGAKRAPARSKLRREGGLVEMATTMRPDPTLYPSPRLAREAPAETLAYMVTYDPTARQPDALLTIDVDAGSPHYREVVGRLEMPNLGDELHHFGWNVCSSALCPYAPHPHTERRYLLLPGLRSSRIYVVDTQPNPRRPRIVKTVEADEIARRAGYSRP